jgi:hypothetical protein
MGYGKWLGLVISVLLGSAVPVHAREPLPQPWGAAFLTIEGNIRRTNAPDQARFDREKLGARGSAFLKSNDILSDRPRLFDGVPIRAVLEQAKSRGVRITTFASNDYEIVIPIDDLKFEPLITMKADGQLLKIRDKGPLWIVYPRDDYKVLQDIRYDSRWVWQLNRLRIE